MSDYGIEASGLPYNDPPAHLEPGYDVVRAATMRTTGSEDAEIGSFLRAALRVRAAYGAADVLIRCGQTMESSGSTPTIRFLGAKIAAEFPLPE